MMQFTLEDDVKDFNIRVIGTLSRNEYMMDPKKAIRDIAQQIEARIVSHVAEEFLKDHLQDVIAAIDVQAVANLALVNAAQRVMEQFLEKKR